MRLTPALLLALLASCATSPEARSLDGRALFAPPLSPDVHAKRTKALAEAQAAVAARADDLEARIWLGRRLAYLGRFRDAIAAFDAGLARWPDEPRLLRHRGHRWITVRQLGAARADLERAAALLIGVPDEVEPDGIPNARGVPTSTLHTNVWYHLGLACWLQGDFAAAERAWSACQDACRNPDMLCATVYWRWLTLRRLGRDADAKALLAPIHAELDVFENHAYHRLLLGFAGQLDLDDLLDQAQRSGDGVDPATIGYGVGMGHWLGGRPEHARAVWARVVEQTPWAAFGHVAAEAELFGRPRAAEQRVIAR